MSSDPADLDPVSEVDRVRRHVAALRDRIRELEQALTQQPASPAERAPGLLRYKRAPRSV